MQQASVLLVTTEVQEAADSMFLGKIALRSVSNCKIWLRQELGHKKKKKKKKVSIHVEGWNRTWAAPRYITKTCSEIRHLQVL
jgi:hypothetical protein